MKCTDVYVLICFLDIHLSANSPPDSTQKVLSTNKQIRTTNSEVITVYWHEWSWGDDSSSSHPSPPPLVTISKEHTKGVHATSFYMNTRCNLPCSDSAAQYLPALVIILMMGKLWSYPNSSAFCPHPQLQKNHPTSPPVPWLCSIFYTLLVAKRPEVANGMLIMLWLNCPLLKTTHRDFLPRNQLGGSGEQGKLCKGSWGMHWGQEPRQRSGGNTVTCQVTHHWFCRM